ncbi:MAG: NAD(+) diphosphatase [Bifidobacteriaceae bacterium]|nr:NAD(+) diphosphatase [Bifidobacteriaceae bacterium]
MIAQDSPQPGSAAAQSGGRASCFSIGVIPGAVPWLLVADAAQPVPPQPPVPPVTGFSLPDAAGSFPFIPPDPVGDGIHLVLCPPGTPAAPGTVWRPARDALACLEPTAQAVALRAIAVANWRQRSPFCPACGAPVEPDREVTGWRCSVELVAVFPRTDPCVITAVLDQDSKLLLSHNSGHAERMFTLVAGFVEAGESLEDAVQRETLEEVGLALDQMRFLRSQPWPFPGSLMASFVALAKPGRIVVDGSEIVEAAWFTRAELDQAISHGRITLPMSYSVARQTIEAWRAGDLTW